MKKAQGDEIEFIIIPVDKDKCSSPLTPFSFHSLDLELNILMPGESNSTQSTDGTISRQSRPMDGISNKVLITEIQLHGSRIDW